MHRLTHTGPTQTFAPCGSPLATPCPTAHTVGRRPALAWRINTASRKPESHWIADSDKPPLPRLWRSTLPSH